MNAYGRTPDNTNAKVAIGVVAGVVIAVVGFNLLSAVGGSRTAVLPSPSPTHSPSPTPGTPPPSPSPVPVVVGPPDEDDLVVGRSSWSIDGIPFSLIVPSDWESFGPERDNYISASIPGSGQGAEAKITWAEFPDSAFAGMCHYLASQSIGPSAADLAVAVSEVPGTDIVSAPSDVTVGGFPAKYVKFVVRDDVGCDPGFFFTYPNAWGGALWPETVPGDTIRVWIVEVGGTLFFIEGATHRDVGPELEQEIQEIVDSIQFASPLAMGEYVAQVDAVCRAASARAQAGPPEEKAWIENAVRVSDEALAELRALPAPDDVRARMFEVFALLEGLINILREVSAAMSAGDIELVDRLQAETLDQIHGKDSRVMEIGPPSLGLVLQGCPIMLPA